MTSMQGTDVSVNMGGHSTIHRFFDTSPFSPCGRYFAVTRFIHGDYVEENEVRVIVVDLLEGREIVVGTSAAWGSQVGAHVQWGDTAVGPSNRTVLYYNDIRDRKLVGVAPDVVCIAYDIATEAKTVLRGPLYQAQHSGAAAARLQYTMSSQHASDRFLASPDLTRIQRTQRGYGVDRAGVASIGAGDVAGEAALLHDGLFVTNVRTNKCHLVLSLYELLFMVARWQWRSIDSPPQAHGFHVKWSDDGQFIMFIVRTLHRYGRDRSRRRRQHLFVINFPQLMRFRKANRDTVGGRTNETDWLVHPNSSHTCYDHLGGMGAPLTTERTEYEKQLNMAVHYVLSWGNIDKGRGTASAGEFNVQLDGNHPNFVLDSHRIVMNLESPKVLEMSTAAGSPSAGWYAVVVIDVPSLIAEKLASSGPSVNTMAVDSTAYYWKAAETHPRFKLSQSRESAANALYMHNLLSYVREVYPYGSGHPTMFAIPGKEADRFVVLTDCYLKELPRFHGFEFRDSHLLPFAGMSAIVYDIDVASSTVPIRLIDLHSQKELWISVATVAVAADSWVGNVGLFYQYLIRNRPGGDSGEYSNILTQLTSSAFFLGTALFQATFHRKSFRHQHLNHWRCDPHVSVSPDFKKIAFNNVVDGNRQVFISNSIVLGLAQLSELTHKPIDSATAS